MRMPGREALAVLGLVWMTATGCLTGRRAATATLPAREPMELLGEVETRDAEWSTLGLRLESTASAMGKAGTFTLNVRMAKDSVIWMSISPALGVEVNLAFQWLLTGTALHQSGGQPGEGKSLGLQRLPRRMVHLT